MPQPFSHVFDPTILREYDIRGLAEKNFTPKDAEALGRAFGTYLTARGGKSVAVGRDGRLSSPALENALIAGLMAAGCAVMAIGLGPTPMLYFAAQHLKADAGMMITGSHNPAPYNGCKMLLANHLRDGGSVYGAAIKEIGAIAASGQLTQGEGTRRAVEVQAAYQARLLAAVPNLQAMKVVWDCGNGAAGAVVPALVKQLPGQHEVLFGEVDGRFPNHHPDPTVPANLRDLQARVAARGADVGIAFDGDGDRIGAIDGQGRIVAGDQLVALYAIEVLKNTPGATIIADVKASQSLFDWVGAHGGQPLMWKTGHSLIKTKMKETGAPLAGEMSGHIFFADEYFGFDDAIYAGLRLLRLISQQGKSLASLRDALPQAVNTPELRYEVEESQKFAIVEAIQAELTAAGANFVAVDGVRVKTPDGWWLLRASNTQNVLVARAEAANAAGLAKLQSQLQAVLAKAGVDTNREASH